MLLHSFAISGAFSYFAFVIHCYLTQICSFVVLDLNFNVFLIYFVDASFWVYCSFIGMTHFGGNIYLS